LPQQREEKDFEVWEENWESVMFFIKMMTQWRTTMGGVIGLDYSVLQMLFDLYDVSNRKEIFENIQVMEQEAMMHMNKEKK
tara:strand:- start:3263 stop:3505 length:243 start_codon:yes stop_codon:yes gene_type:complete